MTARPSGPRILYGRRRGRRLRPGQRALLAELLPRLRITLPAAGRRLDLEALFPRPMREFWLEIGFGGGEHLAAQAAAHPDIGFIGCEPFLNGIATLLAAVRARGLANVRVFDDDARLLLAALPPACLGRAFILFPDPWPKKRHHKRRIVSAGTLDHLARALRAGAELRLSTDDPGYLRGMLALLLARPEFVWLARTAADWRERPADWPPTRYEAKAKGAGKRCYFLRFARRAESAPGPASNPETTCRAPENGYILEVILARPD